METKPEPSHHTFMLGSAHTQAESLIYGPNRVNGWEENRERRVKARQEIINLAERLKIEAAQGCL